MKNKIMFCKIPIFKKKSDLLISVWNVLGVAIILGFFIFSMIIGGTAQNGYIADGMYFVCEHSDTVQVSECIWHISYIWGVLFWLFIPLTPIGAYLISYIEEKSERRKNRLE